MNWTSNVVGVTVDDRQKIIAGMTGKESAKLVPEPDNKFDNNALAVMVDVGRGEIRRVGYLPREIAAKLAPILNGDNLPVKIKSIVGGGNTFYGIVLDIEIEVQRW